MGLDLLKEAKGGTTEIIVIYAAENVHFRLSWLYDEVPQDCL